MIVGRGGGKMEEETYVLRQRMKRSHSGKDRVWGGTFQVKRYL